MGNQIAFKGMSSQLLVRNIAVSIDFYTRHLDFSVDFNYDGFYVGLSNQGYTIHIKQAEPDREERLYKRLNAHLDLLIYVEDLDSVHNTIAAHGVEILQPLRSMPYGREFYIADPDGYILGFMELP